MTLIAIALIGSALGFMFTADNFHNLRYALWMGTLVAVACSGFWFAIMYPDALMFAFMAVGSLIGSLVANFTAPQNPFKRAFATIRSAQGQSSI